MKREDRLSAGMTPEKVDRVYAVLKEAFEKRRKKLREAEERTRAALPSGLKLESETVVTLCPGLYGLWVTICCWRRVYGYDWFMLPEF